MHTNYYFVRQRHSSAKENENVSSINGTSESDIFISGNSLAIASKEYQSKPSQRHQQLQYFPKGEISTEMTQLLIIL